MRWLRCSNKPPPNGTDFRSSSKVYASAIAEYNFRPYYAGPYPTRRNSLKQHPDYFRGYRCIGTP